MPRNSPSNKTLITLVKRLAQRNGSFSGVARRTIRILKTILSFIPPLRSYDQSLIPVPRSAVARCSRKSLESDVNSVAVTILTAIQPLSGPVVCKPRFIPSFRSMVGVPGRSKACQTCRQRRIAVRHLHGLCAHGHYPCLLIAPCQSVRSSKAPM